MQCSTAQAEPIAALCICCARCYSSANGRQGQPQIPAYMLHDRSAGLRFEWHHHSSPCKLRVFVDCITDCMTGQGQPHITQATLLQICDAARCSSWLLMCIQALELDAMSSEHNAVIIDARYVSRPSDLSCIKVQQMQRMSTQEGLGWLADKVQWTAVQVLVAV